jgi:hypothetical protein
MSQEVKRLKLLSSSSLLITIKISTRKLLTETKTPQNFANYHSTKT